MSAFWTARVHYLWVSKDGSHHKRQRQCRRLTTMEHIVSRLPEALCGAISLHDVGWQLFTTRRQLLPGERWNAVYEQRDSAENHREWYFELRHVQCDARQWVGLVQHRVPGDPPLHVHHDFPHRCFWQWNCLLYCVHIVANANGDELLHRQSRPERHAHGVLLHSLLLHLAFRPPVSICRSFRLSLNSNFRMPSSATHLNCFGGALGIT